MAARLLIIFLIFTSSGAFSQYFSKEKELAQKVTLAKNDEERIRAMGELAGFYYIFRAVNKGDSVLQKQLLLAEMSNNKKLIFNTLFSDAVNNFFDWSSSDAYNKALAFLDKGLSFAAETGDKEYEAITHSRKAMLFRKREDYNNALEQTLLALASAQKLSNDSLKSSIYIEAGDVFLGKRDFIPAYKNFNLAFDLAYSVNNIPLQSELYHRYSDIYHALSDSDEVIKNLLKSLDLNKTHGNQIGLMKDYFDLARMSEKKEWIDTLIETAEKVKSIYYSLQGRRLLFAYIMVIEKDSKKALSFLRADEELNQSYLNMGTADYNWTIGNVFKYAGQPDSAIWYFNLGKAALEKTVDATIIQTMNKDIGECYAELKQSKKAIECLEKAMVISDSLGNIFEGMGLASQLGPLYAETGDYKKAYEINRKKNIYQDSLGEQSKQKNVLRLELERQNSIHEKDLADLDKQASRLRELQYVGISIAIASIFIFMLLLGMFPISRLTIRLLGFMAFICLFEFIVLLIDNKLHKIFNGEPLKIWLVKIGLIALLVPVQHFMEHAMVRFLASQRLLRMRQKLSVKRLWAKLVTSIKKPAPVKTEAGLEEDTAVL